MLLDVVVVPRASIEVQPETLAKQAFLLREKQIYTQFYTHIGNAGPCWVLITGCSNVKSSATRLPPDGLGFPPCQP